ncbi:GFA family protein [Terrarubrum flagellatum]|uniref:GFA family protein n=1 Tax=Terrirubrum flagellatum TaxID=2895980 RepID=UPI0031452648
MPTERTGRCLCGAVHFVARGEPKWVAHCHCESCRRATSAAFATYAGYLVEAVEWSGEKPAAYNSSPGVTRSFCPRCGSPVSFTGERWPDEVHLFLPSFEEPNSLAPKGHVYCETQLSWIHLDDGLPRFAKTAREGPPLK